MGWELSADYRLRWMDFDRFGRLRPSCILDIFQDVATLQANDMGIGRDDMLAKDVFWAVIRQKYVVDRQPRHGEVLTARTWPHSPRRFSFMRDYSLADEEGNILVRGSSEWVLMGIRTRQLTPVEGKVDAPFDFCPERCFQEKMRKLASFPLVGQPARATPSTADIDVNGHVNNTRYAAYVEEALDLSEEEVASGLQMDYRQEALAGEELRLFTHRIGSEVDLVGISPTDEVSFACRLELR